MITTCDMRHLYNAKPKLDALILQAKAYERRRCNHQDLSEPLSTLECLCSVVDPKNSLTNKHRYIVATNDPAVRARLRRVAGVPLIYISKSVVLLEPMASVTEEQRAREEKSKFKQGLKGQRQAGAGQKRKGVQSEEGAQGGDQSIVDGPAEDARPLKKRRQKGPKEPNPLSIKKPQKDSHPPHKIAVHNTNHPEAPAARPSTDSTNAHEAGPPELRKRKRKHKPKGDGGVAVEVGDSAIS